MDAAFFRNWPKPCTSGASATRRDASFPSGLNGTCTTSACPPPTSPTKSTSRSGGPDGRQPPAPPVHRGAGFLSQSLERAMTALRFDDLRQHSNVLRSRSGEAITVRVAERRDADSIQNYFRGLSAQSRYNRFLCALCPLSPSLVSAIINILKGYHFS